MSGDGGGGGHRSEAERLLGVAEKLLQARDLVGSKSLAERAIESDPLLDGAADQVIAVADVLLASERRVNGHADWYAVLQLDPVSHRRDPSAASAGYRRLALLLRPDRNRLPGADAALRLVSDAWSVLSDPAKKSVFDAELEAGFWTACPNCCHVYQYERAYERRRLRCQNCRQAFEAVATPPPPIVPGTDMYYSSWGFFPLGFTGSVGGEFRPFYPMAAPWLGNQPPPSDANHGSRVAVKGNVGGNLNSALANKKAEAAAARKAVRESMKKRAFVAEAEPVNSAVLALKACEGTQARPVLIDLNDEVEQPEGNGDGSKVREDSGMAGFDIDLDVSDMDVVGELLNDMTEFKCPGDDGKVDIQAL